jgi:glycosyltransferase involved in cell wall biosynthesis
MPRLLLLTASELTLDPRARRATVAARARGIDVVGLSGRVSGEDAVPLDGVRVERVGSNGRTRPAQEEGLPPRRNVVHRELRGLVRLGRLTARTFRLWRGGRSLGSFDVVHANDLDTLPAGWLLARRTGARLVYDAHELYAEFDAHPARGYTAVASKLEAVLARRAAAVATVNDPLARELEQRLSLRRPARVVLNAPELDPREPLEREDSTYLAAVYQGALGPGRPLSDLLDALEAAPSVRLGLRVVRFDTRDLEARAAARGLADRVDVLDPLPPHRIADGLRDFEVGLIFDRPLTRNTELSLPNKLFEYLMAGLAVVAPRLPGLVRVVEDEGVGVTYTPGRPRELGEVLEGLAHDRPRLAELRRRARRLAVERYNAEAQAPVLAEAWGTS